MTITGQRFIRGQGDDDAIRENRTEFARKWVFK